MSIQSHGITKDMFSTTHQCEEDNVLGLKFFSEQNLNIIQGRIRRIVYEKTGYIIGRQSDEHVAYIMRAVYLEHSLHGRGVAQEMERLNAIVVSILFPMIASNISQYVGYLRDASRIPAPLTRPTNESVKGRNNNIPFFK